MQKQIRSVFYKHLNKSKFPLKDLLITSKVFILMPWYLKDMICMAFWINGENDKSIAIVDPWMISIIAKSGQFQNSQNGPITAIVGHALQIRGQGFSEKQCK